MLVLLVLSAGDEVACRLRTPSKTPGTRDRQRLQHAGTTRRGPRGVEDGTADRRGGRAKRHFVVTAGGLREVRAAKKALTQLWRHSSRVEHDLSRFAQAAACADASGTREALIGDLLEESRADDRAGGCANS